MYGSALFQAYSQNGLWDEEAILTLAESASRIASATNDGQKGFLARACQDVCLESRLRNHWIESSAARLFLAKYFGRDVPITELVDG